MKKVLIIFVILTIGESLIYKNEVNYENDNLYIGYYDGSEKLNSMPVKDNSDNLVFDYGECDNGANVVWDNDSWAPLVKDLSKSKTKCSLYFKEKESIEMCNKYGEDSALCYLTKLGDSDYETMFYDHASANGVFDNNLRYAGLEPNNYIDIGDRDANSNPILWRIIGIMNNMDNGNGIKESRIKIIRSEPIGYYAWDDGKSKNDWSQSALMQVLNEGAYWNKISGKCPVKKDLMEDCDFSVTGLSDKAKSLISDEVWPLGGYYTASGINARQFYEKERGKEVYEGNPNEWIGKVGLMYPSDYLYAVSPKLTDCKDVIDDNYTKFNCHKNNWLMNNEIQWTITVDSRSSYSLFRVNFDFDDKDGKLYFNGSNFANNSVRPVVYLSTNVKITSGNGTKGSPYVADI